MSCQKCKSERVGTVGGKTSDLANFSVYSEGIDHQGEVPSIPVIGGGDYLSIDFCLDCGQIQGEFPINTDDLKDDDDE